MCKTTGSETLSLRHASQEAQNGAGEQSSEDGISASLEAPCAAPSHGPTWSDHYGSAPVYRNSTVCSPLPVVSCIDHNFTLSTSTVSVKDPQPRLECIQLCLEPLLALVFSLASPSV